jgi:hypothetical protein
LQLTEKVDKMAKVAFFAKKTAEARGLMLERLNKELAENLPEEHWARRPEELMVPAAEERSLKIGSLGPLIHLALSKLGLIKNERFQERHTDLPEKELAKSKIFLAHKRATLESLTASLMARDVDDADKKHVLKLVDNAVAARLEEWEIERDRKWAQAQARASDVGSNTETPSTQVQEGGTPSPDTAADKAVA